MNGTSRIAIVGGDAVAWIAALALDKAFRHRQLEVTVVETAGGDDPRGVRWTLPSQRGIHRMIGIDETELLRATGATYRLGTEHDGFQGEGSRYLHAHGAIGDDIGAAPFYKLLIRERLAGRRGNPEDYSLAAVAAKLGRFAKPMGDDKSLTSRFTYGYHLDDRAYAAHLRAVAQRGGIAVVPGPVAGADRAEGGRVQALRLADDRRIAADLFVHTADDPAAADREDWSAWLPCDRIAPSPLPADANSRPLTRISAQSSGWSWTAPLAAATAAGRVWSSSFERDESRATQPAIAFRNGRRRRFWEGNVVRVGAAAMQLEPLAGADLHFAQLGIVNLIELFPFDASSAFESVEYDRVMTEHADALRDFTIAHYRAGKPRDGEFWRETRRAPLPDTLANKLDLFAANGRMDLRDHETFEETDWAWVLLGAGALPRSLELQIASRLEAVAPDHAAALGTQIQWLTSSMPRHLDYLQKQLAPRK